VDEDFTQIDDSTQLDGSVDESSVEEFSADDAAVDEAVVDETPVDESVVEEPEARAADAPFDGVEVPHTGDARVDEVLARLLDLAGAPVADHVAIYDAVHRGLRDCLADLEPASPGPARR
jgi:hypothetical protein